MHVPATKAMAAITLQRLSFISHLRTTTRIDRRTHPHAARKRRRAGQGNGQEKAAGAAYEALTTDGNQVASCGNIASSASNRNIAATNGKEPAITSFIDPPLRRFCTTNRLSPTGGVISAASTSTMTTIPNH